MRQDGRGDYLERFSPASLEMIRNDEGTTLAQYLAEPAISVRDPEQERHTQAQVEGFLSCLPAPAQEILRRLYGLLEQDGRPRTVREVAAELGMTPHGVDGARRRGLLRLRAIAQGRVNLPAVEEMAQEVTPSQKHTRTTEMHSPRTAQQFLERGQSEQTEAPSPEHVALVVSRTTTEKQEQLERASLYLQQQGQRVTAAQLARLAEVSFITASKFLRRREQSTDGFQQPCAERLEEAYAHLQITAGKRITAYALSKQADVHVKTAERFLERQGMQRAQNPQQRCAGQLEQACAQLQAQGTPITIKGLARSAGVHSRTAQRFLEAHPSAQVSRQASRRDPQVQAQGTPITERALARQAGVSRQSAKSFLHPAQKREMPQRPCAERLEEASAQLQATGKPITAYALQQGAQVHWSTAMRFLQKRQPVSYEQRAQQPEQEVYYV